MSSVEQHWIYVSLGIVSSSREREEKKKGLEEQGRKGSGVKQKECEYSDGRYIRANYASKNKYGYINITE